MIEDLIHKNDSAPLMKTPTSQHTKMIFSTTPDKELNLALGSDE
jgi:hypothetical protein